MKNSFTKTSIILYIGSLTSIDGFHQAPLSISSSLTNSNSAFYPRKGVSSTILYANPTNLNKKNGLTQLSTSSSTSPNENKRNPNMMKKISQSSTGLGVTSYSPEATTTMDGRRTKNGEMMPYSDYTKVPTMQETTSSVDGLMKIFYCTCLITSNTVGASMLVLPDAVRSSGVVVPALAASATFLINIITSFYLSDISIEQYQSGIPEAEVPTSFKDIAKEAFGPVAGNILSFLSVTFNYCILIFGVIRFGDVAGQALTSNLDSLTSVNPLWLYLTYAGMLISALSLFSNVALSQVSSVLVAIMVPGFLGLIIPGLQTADWNTFVSNAGGLFHNSMSSTMGSDGILDSDTILKALVTSGPLLLFNMEIQKIVPSVTKLCQFDRTLSRTSIVLGGMIPPLIYTLFVYVNIGNTAGMMEQDDVFLIFKLTTLIGAAMAASMSSSEEFESLLSNFSFPTTTSSEQNGKTNNIPLMESSSMPMQVPELKNDNQGGQRYTFPAVLCAIVPPLLIGLHLAQSGDEGVVSALDFAGGYITPSFIWIFPALLAWNRMTQKNTDDDTWMGSNPMVDGLSVLGEKMVIGSVLMAAVGVTCLEMIKDFGDLSF